MTAPKTAEKVARYAEPVRPGPVLPGLVDDRFAHVEEHARDHPAIVPSAFSWINVRSESSGESVLGVPSAEVAIILRLTL